MYWTFHHPGFVDAALWLGGRDEAPLSLASPIVSFGSPPPPPSNAVQEGERFLLQGRRGEKK